MLMLAKSAKRHAGLRQSVDKRPAMLSARANLDRSVGAEVAQIFRASNLQTDGSGPQLSRADNFAETNDKRDVDSQAPKNRTNFRASSSTTSADGVARMSGQLRNAPLIVARHLKTRRFTPAA